jgi:hypothetical protein
MKNKNNNKNIIMSSMNYSDSVSSAFTNTEELPKKILENIVAPLVKGTICGIVHLVVFTMLKHKFIDKVK